jgi:acyl-coenzyme A thioesterase PaaI-like protein
VLTKADKLGNTIGYCSMELVNQAGELVARGKHIRYLQMGLHFDLMSHPIALPWVVRAYELFFARKSHSTMHRAVGKDIFPLPKGFPSIDGVGKVFEALGLERVSYDSVLVDGATAAAHGPDNSALFTSLHGRVPADRIRAFAMTVRPITSNLLGNMHGGAVACAVEHACVLSRAQGVPEEERGSPGYRLGCFVDSVEVRYISAMKGDLHITVADDVHAPVLQLSGAAQPVASRSFGKVLSAEDGAQCAEYVCTWKAL